MNQWPQVPLGEVLHKSEDWIQLHPDRTYKEVTVRLWGKGATLRKEIAGAEIASATRLQVHANQFIISRIDARNGASGLIPEELEGAVVSNDFPVFTPNPTRLDPHYLGWLSKTKSFVELCKAASEGTTNRVRLKEERFLAAQIALPPLPEQRRLIERIDGLAAKIDEAKALRLQAERESAILAFAPFQVLSIPDSDRTCETLRDYITSHDSGWSPQCEETPASKGEWGVLKTTCVQWHGFQEHQNKALMPGMKAKQGITVVKDDILLTRAGPVNRVGIACKVPNTHSTLMLSDKLVRLRTKATLLPDYLVAYCATPFAQDYFRQGKTGLAESQVNISREKLLRLPVYVPSLVEQHRLLKWITSIREKTISLASLQNCTLGDSIASP